MDGKTSSSLCSDKLLASFVNTDSSQKSINQLRRDSVSVAITPVVILDAEIAHDVESSARALRLASFGLCSNC